MKLTHFYPNASVKDAANLFREHTLATALQMYENGWSIIKCTTRPYSPS